MIKIKKIKIYHLEYPLKNFVISSFGLMKSRPALLIEVKDFNNNVGLGEIWCNFPSDGPAYKFNLLKNIPSEQPTSKTLPDFKYFCKNVASISY